MKTGSLEDRVSAIQISEEILTE